MDNNQVLNICRSLQDVLGQEEAERLLAMLVSVRARAFLEGKTDGYRAGLERGADYLERNMEPGDLRDFYVGAIRALAEGEG